MILIAAKEAKQPEAFTFIAHCGWTASTLTSCQNHRYHKLSNSMPLTVTLAKSGNASHCAIPYIVKDV